jgi:hypothetical protein
MTYGRVPRRWNAYRPTYRRENTYTPPYSDDDRHSSSRPSRLESGSRSPLDTSNPNNIPVARRSSMQVKSDEVDEISHLMGVTSRAYELVIHYEEQSMGGTRWTAKDIELIRDTGRHLATDVRALHDLHKEVTRMSDGRLVDQLYERVADMRRYCHLIQDFIKDRENVPKNQRKSEVLPLANARSTSPDFAIKGAAAREEAFKETATHETTSTGEMEWVSVEDEIKMAVRTYWANSLSHGEQVDSRDRVW